MVESIDSKPKTERVGDEVPAQIFHDRAKDAANEIHKLLLSFSGATLGVYFIALTKEISQITRPQIVASLAGIVMMGTAVFVGLLGLFADMKRYYFWGCARQEHDHKKRDAFYQERDRWLARQHLVRPVLFIFFSLGIISSIVFMVFRITNI
jgi:hypothetical protein